MEAEGTGGGQPPGRRVAVKGPRGQPLLLPSSCCGQTLARGQGPARTLPRTQRLGRLWWKKTSGPSELPSRRDPVVDRPDGEEGSGHGPCPAWAAELRAMC